jgi:hypothetical protein
LTTKTCPTLTAPRCLTAAGAEANTATGVTAAESLPMPARRPGAAARTGRRAAGETSLARFPGETVTPAAAACAEEATASPVLASALALGLVGVATGTVSRALELELASVMVEGSRGDSLEGLPEGPPGELLGSPEAAEASRRHPEEVELPGSPEAWRRHPEEVESPVASRRRPEEVE